MAGYGLLGATWLVMKTEGELQLWARGKAEVALMCTLAALCLVSVWTALGVPRISDRWFSWPNLLLLAPIPLLTLYAALKCWRGLIERSDVQPFFSAIAMFLLGFAGLVISNVPYLVPDSIDVWQAAAAPSSLLFMLVGTLLLLPMILGYTAFVYWTFRGKVREDTGYH